MVVGETPGRFRHRRESDDNCFKIKFMLIIEVIDRVKGYIETKLGRQMCQDMKSDGQDDVYKFAERWLMLTMF